MSYLYLCLNIRTGSGISYSPNTLSTINPIVKIIIEGVPTATATAIICLIFIILKYTNLAYHPLFPSTSGSITRATRINGLYN